MQSGSNPLRVVLVHWNQAASCLDTIDRFGKGSLPVRITVVDNGSREEEIEKLRLGIASRVQDGGAAELVELPTNRGFGPGANVGLQRFLNSSDDGEWVVLAPHDVDPAPTTLQRMSDAAAARPMAGLMCADVGDAMSPVLDPYFGGMVVPAAATRGLEPGGGLEPTGGWESVDYPHGTLMMLRRTCLVEVGLFDERFFSYCEEAELALRARRSGWEVGLIRGALVHNRHLGSSVRMVDYLQTRNTLLLVQEMSGWYHAFVRVCFTLVQVSRGVVDEHSTPPVFDARARLRGIVDFTLRRFGAPPPSMR